MFVSFALNVMHVGKCILLTTFIIYHKLESPIGNNAS